MGILSFASALTLIILLAIPAFADDVDNLIIGLTDQNYTVRADAALALGNLQDPRALGPLIEALNDSNSGVRVDATRALFVLKDARTVDPLILVLSDEDSEVRAGAASALGWIKDRKAIDPLIRALDDDDAVVRSTAAASLGVINETKAVEPLIRALDDDADSSVRANAAIGLGQLKSHDAVNPLIQALSDNDSEVRWRAAYSLGEIGDNLAKDPLKQALDDDNATVREEATAALEKIEPQQSVAKGKIASPKGTPANKGGDFDGRQLENAAIFNNGNAGSVEDSPSCSPSFTIDRSYYISSIENYHWNYGSGTTEAGTIGLQKEDGTIYGPWNVEASSGQGGVPNAMWIAHPEEIVPPGTYIIVDSDPSTWSQNSDSSNCGFSKVEGHIEPGAKPGLTKTSGSQSRSYQVGPDQIAIPSSASLIQTSEWGMVPANQVVVMLKEGKGRTDADRLASDLGGQVVGFFNYINLYQIETSGTTEAELIDSVAKAKQDPDVELAFPNQQAVLDATIHGIQCSPLDDPVYTEGGRGKDYEMIGVQRAWDLIRVSGLSLSKVHVGVVDDGLYKGNDEFNGKVKIYTSEQNSELQNSLGKIYDSDGKLIADYTVAGSHGTSVMNIIAANPDNGGITGIASEPLGDKLETSMINNYAPPYGENSESAPDPNDPTKIAWTNGKTYTFGDLLAINKSVNDGAKIISCSWGNRAADPNFAAASKQFFEKMANDHPDVLFVCSAGNERISPDGARTFPGGLQIPNMITVGNIMNDGSNTANSNMASNNFEVTLAAPGEESVSGFDNKGGIKSSLGGTSMATPQVTSAAALIRALNPQLMAGQIKDILVQNARTSVDIDGKKVPAPTKLGGRILAIDEAVFKVINDQRKKLNLTPFPDIDYALGLARIDLVAKNDPAYPNDWKVTAEILSVETKGADVAIELQGEGAIGSDRKIHLSQAGAVNWDVTTKGSATVVVKRLDTNGCNRALLAESSMGLSGKWQTWTIINGVKMMDGSGLPFLYILNQSGSSITLKAPHVIAMDIVGTISGNTFTGTFIDSDTNRTQGNIEITFSPDGNHFTGQKRREIWPQELEWGGDKVSEIVPTPAHTSTPIAQWLKGSGKLSPATS